MTNDPRIDKLPKWAQTLIANQATQIDNHAHQIAELVNEQTPANGWQSTGGWPAQHRYLKADHDGEVRVQFGEPNGARGLYDFEIIFNPDEREIELRASGYEGPLAITPRASNVVIVKAVGR